MYDAKLYKFIRNNYIDWESIEFEILDTLNFEKHEHARMYEHHFIDMYDSIANGTNTIRAYISQKEKTMIRTNKRRALRALGLRPLQVPTNFMGVIQYIQLI